MASSTPSGHPPADRSPYEDVRWLGVLRALAAHHMYHRSTGCSVSGAGVVDFLLQDPAFPRSVRHCTAQMEQLLAELPDRPEVGAAIASLDRVTARLVRAVGPRGPAPPRRPAAAIAAPGPPAVAEAYFASAATPAPRHAAAAGT